MFGSAFTAHRLGAAALGATLVISGMILVAPASAAPSQTGPPPQVLERDMRGEAAISALGSRLPEVAAQNDMSPAELRSALREDSMLWVSRTGQLLFVDEFLGHDHDEAPIDHGTLDGSPVPSATEIFTLHSRRGADRVIVLDFDGHDARGTAWGNTAAQDTTAFDFEGGGGTFTDDERAVIFSVWQRVAEDYAPFDIDVTTQDPGHGTDATGHPTIRRDDINDVQYGTRVVVTPSKPYNCNCGGVAYVGVYDSTGATHDWYQPAWVFTAGVGHGAKNIAEAASHEAGHNLGLSHDGTRRTGYYTGHGDWAPIMGVGYYEPVSQWSRGEYSGANNKEDDFVVIQSNGGPLAADDWPVTVPLLSPASGAIESRADVDSFTVEVRETGVLNVQARPASVSPNLDIRLRITGGGVDVVVDPSLGVSDDRDTTVGLDAHAEIGVAAGVYTVSVDGTGWADPGTTGYSDYGSVGRYTLTTSFTSGGTTATNQQPTAHITVMSNVDRTVSLSGAGSSDSDGRITSWVWDLGDGSDPQTGESVTHTYEADGNYTVRLTVTDDDGAPATTTTTVNAKAPRGKGRPSKTR